MANALVLDDTDIHQRLADARSALDAGDPIRAAYHLAFVDGVYTGRQRAAKHGGYELELAASSLTPPPEYAELQRAIEEMRDKT